MKKLLVLLAVLLGISSASYARDEYVHDVNVLPQKAQTTLSKHFKADVSVIKIDKTLGRVDDYEVILTDGTEVTFERDGDWDSVETARNGSVPTAFIPKSVADYVAQRHPGTKVIGIDRDRSGYEVELSNGMDIRFNRDGKFVKYDD